MTYADQLDTDILTFLKRHENKELLRFVTVGSVDDGKSTLIGRLLHDTHGVYEDQLSDARRNAKGDQEIDFSLLTDGLRAEREQGITIDVAYRYFTTARRKFIIADTPGHIQYTRNMATGASTADIAIILIDARLGVLPQSRRHAWIASLLGIPRLMVAVNKMDLKDYDQEVYDSIVADFTSVTHHLNFRDVVFFPVSALKGDNVVTKSSQTPWYDGPTLLEFLETVDIQLDRSEEAWRYPVQMVLRPHLDYRGFAGQIVSGIVRKGDRVTVLPSRKTSRVKAIDTYNGELAEAFAPMSVTLRLEDEIDISRGDILAHPDNLPAHTRSFCAHVVWMHDTPLDPSRSYLLKHSTQYIRATFERVDWKMNMETLEQTPCDTFELNDVGYAKVTCVRALSFDPYTSNRSTGAFIVVDPQTNATLAAGMISEAVTDTAQDDTTTGPQSSIALEDRIAQTGHAPMTLWLQGDTTQAATVAFALERALFDRGVQAHVLGTRNSDGETPDVWHMSLFAKHCHSLALTTIAVSDREPATELPNVRIIEVGPEKVDVDALVRDLMGAL